MTSIATVTTNKTLLKRQDYAVKARAYSLHNAVM